MKPYKGKAETKKSGRIGKVKLNSNKNPQGHISPDLSKLRKPIQTSITNLFQISQLLQNSTNEVKDILTNDCDIIFECRVCRSLFRSLVNFISHKRVYCVTKFNINSNRNHHVNFDIRPITEIISTQVREQPVSINNKTNDRILRSQVLRNHKKDLTGIIDMLYQKQNENSKEMSEFLNNGLLHSDDDNKTVIECIDPNSSLAYETVFDLGNSKISNIDTMKTQVLELHNMTREKAGVVDSNGKLIGISHVKKCNYSAAGCGSDDDSESSNNTSAMQNLVCYICNAKFSTKKTLTFHLKTLHTSHRMCYPCPCCSNIFTNTWSVYRHLFKIHRKTNDQVRKLRSQIQERAYRKEVTETQHDKKSTTTVNENVNNEVSDKDIKSPHKIQKCKNCKMIFQKTKELFSHSRICHTLPINSSHIEDEERSESTTQETTAVDTSDISDTANTPSSTDREISSEKSSSYSSSENENDQLPLRIETITSITESNWNLLDVTNSSKNRKNSKVDMISSNNLKRRSCDDVIDSSGVVYTNGIESTNNSSIVCVGSKRRKTKNVYRISQDYNKSNGDELINTQEEEEIIIPSDTVNPSTSKVACNDGKTIVTIMEDKIASKADLQKLQCLMCKRKFTSMTNLRRHMAVHIGWNRYRCTECNFKCFFKCECVAHCNKMHNAKNKRSTLAEMIVEIPEEEYTSTESDQLDNEEDNNTEVEIIDFEKTEVTTNDKPTDSINRNEIDNIDGNSFVHDMQFENTENVKHSKVISKVELENSTNNNELTDEIKSTAGNFNSDLRRMVMEVIFGNTGDNTDKKLATTINQSNDLEKKINDENNCDFLEDENQKLTQVTKEQEKPQRPVRNRIKPVNNDFIYDLKEVTSNKEKSKIALNANKLQSKKTNSSTSLNCESHSKSIDSLRNTNKLLSREQNCTLAKLKEISLKNDLQSITSTRPDQFYFVDSNEFEK